MLWHRWPSLRGWSPATSGASWSSSKPRQANAVAQVAVFAQLELSHKQRLAELLKVQASSQLSRVLSSPGWGQQLTVEMLLQAKVLCGWR